jgi:hypothetical protein
VKAIECREVLSTGIKERRICGPLNALLDKCR